MVILPIIAGKQSTLKIKAISPTCYQPIENHRKHRLHISDAILKAFGLKNSS